MKKIVLITLAVVVLIVLVGVVVVGVIVRGNMLLMPGGDVTYSDPRCPRNEHSVIIRFARQAGRVDPGIRPIWNAQKGGCSVRVSVSVPKRAASDPLQAIDEAMGPRGWERKGEARWVNPEGFTVRAQNWRRQAAIVDPTSGSYEVSLWGRSQSPCADGGATVMIRFAERVGRVVPNAAGRLAWRNGARCRVMVSMPKTAASDTVDRGTSAAGDDRQAMEGIDEAVRPLGWKRKGYARWVNSEGFTVTAHMEIYEDEVLDPAVTSYPIRLTGRPAD
jgi:hypothetical protein